jgi:hypothetical protein
MTIKSQGWPLSGDGAQMAASRIFSMVSSGIGSGKKLRQLRLPLIATKRSITLLLSSKRFSFISQNLWACQSIFMRFLKKYRNL